MTTTTTATPTLGFPRRLQRRRRRHLDLARLDPPEGEAGCAADGLGGGAGFFFVS